jgi:hypothetical protein
MDQIIVIAWGSIEFLLCPLLFFFFLFFFFFFSFFFSFLFFFLFFSFFLFFFLFFFSNYLQNGKSFDKPKHTKEITFQSPIDPINCRVITEPFIVPFHYNCTLYVLYIYQGDLVLGSSYIISYYIVSWIYCKSKFSPQSGLYSFTFYQF